MRLTLLKSKLHRATVTAADNVDVWLATGDAEFIVHVQDAETLDNDDVDSEFGIVEDSTNEIYRLDTSETSAKVFRVLKLYDAHGDTNGRVIAHAVTTCLLFTL